MASAVLASRNEPCWGERKVYMRKYPNSVNTTTSAKNRNSNVNGKSLLTSQSNPNPAPSHPSNKQIPAHDPSTDIHVKEISSLSPPGGFPAKEMSRAGRVTFNLAAYTRLELKELKERLLSELEQVRILITRAENLKFQSVQPVFLPDPQKLNPSPNCTPKGHKECAGAKRANPFRKSGQKRKQKKRPTAVSLMRSCSQILTKMMKHKHGWVFNEPVDVVSLSLHDYHDIIKNPMDLGTVKLNLERKLYGTVLDFAADVRLTFNNALKYNPQGHDVHVMAETLLGKFERMFKPVVRKFGEIPVTVKKKEMSFEEKAVLGKSLEELPPEKMGEVLSILKKRNGNGDVSAEGDEIELDIDVIDNETLWELDRFVKQVADLKKLKSEVVEVKEVQKVGVGEEEVDIGEEIQVGNFPSVEIERDVSSSSSESSSSSSGESGSSSDDDDDDEDGVKSAVSDAKDAAMAMAMGVET
ncbi:transcription factor GTE7-like [Pistacia vera]|uniref:transcription factor GTE7-like n=1 Tax=Pistacia vera TaxID=55513 RepID=UPI0012637E49|nr:transcription factor GTE7-like [Pistacia vera]